MRRSCGWRRPTSLRCQPYSQYGVTILIHDQHHYQYRSDIPVRGPRSPARPMAPPSTQTRGSSPLSAVLMVVHQAILAVLCLLRLPSSPFPRAYTQNGLLSLRLDEWEAPGRWAVPEREGPLGLEQGTEIEAGRVEPLQIGVGPRGLILLSRCYPGSK